MSSKPQGDTYDPSRKWGLLPKAGVSSSGTRTSSSLGGGATYVLPGHVIASGRSSGPEYVNEIMGRHKDERRKRIREQAAQDADLKKFLGKDGGQSEGAKALSKAREAIGKDGLTGESKDKKQKGGTDGTDPPSKVPSKRAFSATAIQRIGFDPTAKRVDRKNAESEKIVGV